MGIYGKYKILVKRKIVKVYELLIQIQKKRFAGIVECTLRLRSG